jgi:hypothetical protein
VCGVRQYDLVLPFLAILAWQWWVLVSLAHRVIIHEDGTVEWVAAVVAHIKAHNPTVILKGC